MMSKQFGGLDSTGPSCERVRISSTSRPINPGKDCLNLLLIAIVSSTPWWFTAGYSKHRIFRFENLGEISEHLLEQILALSNWRLKSTNFNQVWVSREFSKRKSSTLLCSRCEHSNRRRWAESDQYAFEFLDCSRGFLGSRWNRKIFKIVQEFHMRVLQTLLDCRSCSIFSTVSVATTSIEAAH